MGLWLGPSGGEGAKQWATMLTELRNRGVADALIVCWLFGFQGEVVGVMVASSCQLGLPA